ncbi:MAG: hypothetical protein CYPHOPRED_002399 [Cyphobasidiales sp. Tagirdzhanova-0007]|nr:MAG: hypothetical protein CYPHOPRED_002399 [Cyphobasidiales sp. Tagirdzhanova-0007]
MDAAQKSFNEIISALGIPSDAPAFRKVAALQSLPAHELRSFWPIGKQSNIIMDAEWLVPSTSPHVEVCFPGYFADLPGWLDDAVIGYLKDEAALFGANSWEAYTWDDVRTAIDACGYQPGPRKDPELSQTMDLMSNAYTEYMYGNHPWQDFSMSRSYMSWNGMQTGLRDTTTRSDRAIHFASDEHRSDFIAGCLRKFGVSSIVYSV